MPSNRESISMVAWVDEYSVRLAASYVLVTVLSRLRPDAETQKTYISPGSCIPSGTSVEEYVTCSQHVRCINICTCILERSRHCWEASVVIERQSKRMAKDVNHIQCNPSSEAHVCRIQHQSGNNGHTPFNNAAPSMAEAKHPDPFTTWVSLSKTRCTCKTGHLKYWMQKSTTRLSKSSLPRWVSPAVACSLTRHPWENRTYSG